MIDERDENRTASNEAMPERPQDSSAAMRANGGGDSIAEDGDATHRAAGSASRTGERKPGDDLSDIGGTDEMTGSTGGLAGTSR